MKPDKSRKFCPECGRHKILFETEEKANTFIKYNWRKLTDDRKTLRSYYCVSCCGWHITSSIKKKNKKCRSEKLKKTLSEEAKHNLEKQQKKLQKQQKIDEELLQSCLNPEYVAAREDLYKFGEFDKIYITEYCNTHNIYKEERKLMLSIGKRITNSKKCLKKPKQKYNYGTCDL